MSVLAPTPKTLCVNTFLDFLVVSGSGSDPGGDELERALHRVVRDPIRLHQGDEVVEPRLGGSLDLLEAVVVATSENTTKKAVQAACLASVTV
jgi:hypothetical protein